MKRSILVVPAIALAVAAGAPPQAQAGETEGAILYERAIAQEEEARIISAPIAGIQNRLWFDYRNDIGEAQKELASDLRRATDIEDQRDAWSEYAHELRHERTAYVKKMEKRGYRQGQVIVG